MLTPEQIKALREKEGLSAEIPKTNTNRVLSDFDTLTTPEPSKVTKVAKTVSDFAKDIPIGMAKGAGETIWGVGKLATKGLSKLGIGEFEDKETPEYLKATTAGQKVGKFGERVAEFAVPGSKVGKLMEGASFATKVGSKALTSAGVATAQEGKIGTGTALAGGAEVILPVVGKVVTPIIKKLFGALGAGLGGVSGETISLLKNNPQLGRQASKQFIDEGGDNMMEQHARTIINGVSQIKKEASQKFGEGIQALKKEDIDPKKFRSAFQPFLDNMGISVKGDTRYLDNVEFDDPKNLQKASNLIESLSKVELDGFSLRQLLKKIEGSAYKTAVGDERLAFNAFIRDLANTTKKAISDSTDKLGEINKAYSGDLQLAEATENIFKDVDYKNLEEVIGVARKLENLFSKKGLDPKVINDFLTRIGVNPKEFKVGEAVRQMASKETTPINKPGLSFTELVQAITSSIIDPNMVKNIAIRTGLAEPVAKQIFEKVAPSARGTLLQLLTPESSDE